MKPQKIKVFLAHGFCQDKENESLSEIEVAEWFTDHLKRRGFSVLTGEPPKTEQIDEKIKERIDNSDVVLGLFTRRWEVTKPSAGSGRGTRTTAAKKWICPQFVLSECSYALGLYKSLEIPKLVGGFYESGVDIDDLALITAGGMEVLAFDRQGLDKRHLQDMINTYLDSIPEALGRLTTKGELFVAPYRQIRVRKVVSVYSNGLGITKNSYRIMIPDPDSFNATKGRIRHVLYTDRPVTLPPFDEMRRTSIQKRFKSPFFAVALFSLNNKPANIEIEVSLKNQEATSITFEIGMEGVFRKGSIVEYEYAWGMPRLFAATEEDLDPDHYNEVSLKALHGKISQAILEVNFERRITGAQRTPILADECPFYQLSSQPSLTTSSFGKHVLLSKAHETIWDETYIWERSNFDGSVKISWRPRSRSSANA